MSLGLPRGDQGHDERRRADEALRRSEEGFKRISEAKSEFLALMSHELRTPLSTMLISSEMLADPALGPVTEARARDLGGKISAGGRHLLGLVDDLLDLSRIEAGQLDLADRPDAAGLLLDEVHQALSSTASGEGVQLQLPTGVQGHVLADPLRLRQILFNLLVNAVKFTRAGGRVWVEAHVSADEVVLEVRDTGIGITAEQLERIFVPFEKGSAATPGSRAGHRPAPGRAPGRLPAGHQHGRPGHHVHPHPACRPPGGRSRWRRAAGPPAATAPGRAAGPGGRGRPRRCCA